MAQTAKARFVIGAHTRADQAKDIVVSRVRLHQVNHPEMRVGESVSAVLDELSFVESARMLSALKRQDGIAGLHDGEAARAIISLLIKHVQEAIDAPA